MSGCLSRSARRSKPYWKYHMDFQDDERAAIQEGIDAINNGRFQNFDEFDREFRQANGIAPECGDIPDDSP